MELWSKFSNIFGPPKPLWDKLEYTHDPTITDRVIYYLINYFESASVARKAIRLFLGIDSRYFCDWNEVRVATLRELEDALKSIGCNINTWELVVTLKDFLQNMVETIDTVDLEHGFSDLKPNEITAYFRQLRGYPEAWKKEQSSPFRPDTSLFFKQCRRYRKEDEAILPENVVQYLEYLIGRTSKAPFEYYSNRLFVRLGLFNEEDSLNTKITKFQNLIGDDKPVNKHRQIVQFGKTICISKPRCQICPLTSECQYLKNKSVEKISEKSPTIELIPTIETNPKVDSAQTVIKVDSKVAVKVDHKIEITTDQPLTSPVIKNSSVKLIAKRKSIIPTIEISQPTSQQPAGYPGTVVSRTIKKRRKLSSTITEIKITEPIIENLSKTVISKTIKNNL